MNFRCCSRNCFIHTTLLFYSSVVHLNKIYTKPKIIEILITFKMVEVSKINQKVMLGKENTEWQVQE